MNSDATEIRHILHKSQLINDEDLKEVIKLRCLQSMMNTTRKVISLTMFTSLLV